MKLTFLILPMVLGPMLVTGCVTGPASYSSSGSAWDDSSARNQWEADARNDSLLNQEASEQQAQAAIDAANAAVAAASEAAANP